MTTAEAGERLAFLLGDAEIQDTDACVCEDDETVMLYFLISDEWIAIWVETDAEPAVVLADVRREAERIAKLKRRRHLVH